jgi:hypothetical protein
MRQINLLVASAERRTTNALEALVLDVCYDQAVVETFRTTRIDELVRFGSRDDVHLIVISADHLLMEPSRRNAGADAADVLRAIRLIREHRSTPIVALIMSPVGEAPLLEAGADCVNVGLLLDRDRIKSELRRMLIMPELVETVAPSRWSFGAWLRGENRLKTAA